MAGNECPLTTGPLDHNSGDPSLLHTPYLDPLVSSEIGRENLAGKVSVGFSGVHMDVETEAEANADVESEGELKGKVEEEVKGKSKEKGKDEVSERRTLQRTRGRPPGAKNKPKNKVEPAPREGRLRKKRERVNSLSSTGPETFDIQSPIVVRIQGKLKTDQPLPVKNPRKRMTTVVKDITEDDHNRHVMTIASQEERRHTLNHFGADLQAFFVHLNKQGEVSTF